MRPVSVSTSAANSFGPRTTASRPPGTKRIPATSPRSGTTANVRLRSGRARSTRLTVPSPWPTASRRPSELSAATVRFGPPVSIGRPSRCVPERSQTKTAPSSPAVKSVRPSRLTCSAAMPLACPCSVSNAAPVRTSHRIASPSSLAVTSERPSGVKRAAVTAPRWRPDALRTVPLRRSTKRTEPSCPPMATVRSLALSAIAPSRRERRSRRSLTGFSVRASRSTTRWSESVRTCRPSLVPSSGAFRGGPSDDGSEDPAPAVHVEALHERAR